MLCMSPSPLMFDAKRLLSLHWSVHNQSDLSFLRTYSICVTHGDFDRRMVGRRVFPMNSSSRVVNPCFCCKQRKLQLASSGPHPQTRRLGRGPGRQHPSSTDLARAIGSRYPTKRNQRRTTEHTPQFSCVHCSHAGKDATKRYRRRHHASVHRLARSRLIPLAPLDTSSHLTPNLLLHANLVV